MKRPISIPIICWANIAIHYLIALVLTLVILAVGISFINMEYYLALILPYLNLILVVYLNKMILRGQRWAREIFIAWCIVLNILGHVLFEDIQVTLVSIVFSIANIICLYHSSANRFFVRKDA